jgi:two-component sensor histidine kinase
LFSAERTKILADAEVRYEVRGKDARIARLGQAAEIQRLTNERQRATLALAGAGLLGASGMAGGFFFSARLKQRANLLLEARRHEVERQKAELERAYARREQAEARLQELLAEKEVLLKEVHHRIKNNLQIVAGLLGIQFGAVRDPHVRGAARGIQSRVEAIALVHETLYQSEGLDRLGVQEYLERLVGSLYDTFDTSGGAVAWRVEADGVRLDAETAIPVGLIVTELASNAFKYAFADRVRGEVHVSLRPSADGAVGYALRVADDGVGLPEAYRRGAPGSLGLVLVHDLARQLGGAVRLETGRRDGGGGDARAAAGGTAWTVSFTLGGAAGR